MANFSKIPASDSPLPKRFYIEEGRLHLFYNSYEIGPCATGPTDVTPQNPKKPLQREICLPSGPVEPVILPHKLFFCEADVGSHKTSFSDRL
ncbi:MAG: RsiV family protein [Bacteroidia bacterium]